MNIKYRNLQSRKPQDLTCVTFGTPLGLLFTNELKRTSSGAALYISICFFFYVVGYIFSLPLRSRPTKMIVVIKLSKKRKRKNACRVKLGFAVFTTLPKTQSS